MLGPPSSWQSKIILTSSQKRKGFFCLRKEFFISRLPLVIGGVTLSNLAKPLLALVTSWPQALGIVLLDRAVGMFALLLLPLLLAPLFPQLVRSMPVLRDLLVLAAVLALVMLAGLLMCFSGRMRNSRPLTWVFQEMPGGAYLRMVWDTVRAYRHSFGTLMAVLVIALVTHLLAAGVTLLAAQATNPTGFAWEMIELIPLGHLANTLPLTPGGLGVGEAAFQALYARAGLEGGAAVLLGWRLLSLVIGLAGLVYYLQGRRHFVKAARPSAAVESSN